MRCRPPLEKHIVANIMRALKARPVVVRKRHGTAMTWTASMMVATSVMPFGKSGGLRSSSAS